MAGVFNTFREKQKQKNNAMMIHKNRHSVVLLLLKLNFITPLISTFLKTVHKILRFKQKRRISNYVILY